MLYFAFSPSPLIFIDCALICSYRSLIRFYRSLIRSYDGAAGGG